MLDLGCGPGSLAVRLLGQIPAATVVAIDADPLLLALGQAAWADAGRWRRRPSVAFADQDLRVPGWSGALGLDRQADAAVSTTALHWLAGPELAAMYAEVATVLRPGGLLLNGDHLAEDEAAAPTLARLGRALRARGAAARPARPRRDLGRLVGGGADRSGARRPVAERRAAARAEHHGSPSGRLALHVEALRAAGFTEVGTIWQRGDNRLLCGVLGG